MIRVYALLSVAALSASTVSAQDRLPSDVTFNLKRHFLEELMTSGPDQRSVGARWATTLRMGEHSRVHPVGNDCELHVGARMPNNRVIASPPGVVVEPPSVCRQRVPEITQTGNRDTAWVRFFRSVEDQTCNVTGFPRIFSEHAAGGGEGGSNPDHVVEVHPVTALTCGQTTMNFIPLVKIHPGMKKISNSSARACLEERKLFVRQRGSGTQIRYEFFEEGAKGGSGGSCGNFVVVHADISKEYIRRLSNEGDHVALARVWVDSSGPFPLKIYTYNGTPENEAIAQLDQNPDSLATLEIDLHGLLTYDYFTIAQTVQEDDPGPDGQFDWRPASELKNYVEIRSPLALVVFGRASP